MKATKAAQGMSRAVEAEMAAHWVKMPGQCLTAVRQAGFEVTEDGSIVRVKVKKLWVQDKDSREGRKLADVPRLTRYTPEKALYIALGVLRARREAEAEVEKVSILGPARTSGRRGGGRGRGRGRADR